MNNPIHTKELELDITVAGVTTTHLLRVPYTISEAISALCEAGGMEIVPAEPLSIEIDVKGIREQVELYIDGCDTSFLDEIEVDYLSPEHISGIEREILEGME